jgi:rubrerythrin
MIADNFKAIKTALERNETRDEKHRELPQPAEQQFWCHTCGYKRTCPVCQASMNRSRP